MKRCYYLVLALLLLVITPVAAADFMNDENHLEEIGSSAYFVPEKRVKEL